MNKPPRPHREALAAASAALLLALTATATGDITWPIGPRPPVAPVADLIPMDITWPAPKPAPPVDGQA